VCACAYGLPSSVSESSRPDHKPAASDSPNTWLTCANPVSTHAKEETSTIANNKMNFFISRPITFIAAQLRKDASRQKVRVTNRSNGRSVVVTVNDRGPFVRGRIIDVTPAGAHALGFSGLTPVTVERE
jgi:hypothetical protein